MSVDAEDLADLATQRVGLVRARGWRGGGAGYFLIEHPSDFVALEARLRARATPEVCATFETAMRLELERRSVAASLVAEGRCKELWELVLLGLDKDDAAAYVADALGALERANDGAGAAWVG